MKVTENQPLPIIKLLSSAIYRCRREWFNLHSTVTPFKRNKTEEYNREVKLNKPTKKPKKSEKGDKWQKKRDNLN